MTATRLLFSICILTIIYSCNQDSGVKNSAPLPNISVDSLIKAGKKYQVAQIDSLPPIIQKLTKIAQSTGDKTALVYSEQFDAEYYWMTADHKKSMGLALKSLADAEKWKIDRSIPETYLIIGNLHKENTNYPMAFNAQEKGLYWAKMNHDTASIISLLSLRAMFIHTFRHLSPDTASYKDTSINIQMDALKIAEASVKYERQRIALYDNVSQYYLNKKNYEKAIYFGNKGAETALKLGQRRSLTYSYSWLGQAYYFKGDKQKGLDYLNKALQLTRDLKAPFREMELYGHIADCYLASSDYKTALKLINRSHDISDSLKILNNEKQIGELQIKYESAKKDKEIAEMGRAEKMKNKEIAYMLAGSVLFIALIIVLIFQYRILHRSNRQITKSNVQKDRALEGIAYVQAHELRKPLASILGLINVIKAMDYEVDEECIDKLEQAGHQLDDKICAIIKSTEDDNKLLSESQIKAAIRTNKGLKK